MPKKTEIELCDGEYCPLKETCIRYKENINPKKDLHLAWAPYDDIKDTCTFYIKRDGLFQQLNDIVRGKS